MAEECGQDYTLVTYDLAFGKMVKRIQSKETATFNNLFILFGSFRTEMSFFSSLGRMIEGSGGQYVLFVSDIVPISSINKF